MKNLLGDEEKDTHDKDMQEILKSKEEELRKSKEKKLQGDRKLHKERKRYTNTTATPTYAQIATEHIRKKQEGTKPKSRISTQENISNTDEESDNQRPFRRGGKQGKKPHFRRERSKKRKS